MIRFARVSKHFGDPPARVEALREIDLEIPNGQMCAVMGASGSGKSTLLHLAAGLLKPDSGAVDVGGTRVSELDDDGLAELRRTRIGIVFQFFNLLPYLTASENVGLPLRLEGRPEQEVDAAVTRTLAMVGMAHRAGHKASTLSGGEMQRVAIARALSISPSVLLADEPTGNLDSITGRQIIELLRDLNDETGVTTVVVTHDPVWGSFCDRIVRIADGRISEDIALTGDQPADARSSG